MDKFNEKLPALTHFILPGGCLESTSFNLCRVVCRRVERSLVLMESELPGEVPAEIIIFINRLSDYFFVLGRWLNLKVNMAEVIWKGRA